MADLLDLKINQPELVALAYADGREFPSKIAGAPAQVMFTLVDGRRVFWPRPFADALQEAGIAARQPFEVCKAEIAKGKTQLQFRVIAPTAETPAPIQDSEGTWYERRAVSPPPPPPAPAQTLERLYTAPAVRTAPEPAPAITPAAAAMCAAMCAAVDAVIETQAYASRRGLGVTFSEESVRAIGLTIFIGNQKGGAR